MSEHTSSRGTRLAGRLLIVAALAVALAAIFLLRDGTVTPPQQAVTPATENSSDPVLPDPDGSGAGPKARRAAATGPAGEAIEPAGTAIEPAGTATEPAGAAAEPARAQASEPLPRLVDLGADKCIPCKMMAPILAALRQEYAGRFEVVFIDVWQDRAQAAAYGISIIPTQIFYDPAGKELFRHQGFFSREEILGTWREHGYDFGES